MRKPNAKDKRTAANGVTLQHRHFAFIAATIATLPANTREIAAVAFADACKRTNARFKRERFLAACAAESPALSAVFGRTDIGMSVERILTRD